MTVTSVPDQDSIIELRDGRRIAVAEWGDRDGRPALLFEGSPGSRLFCPDIETTRSAGLRLVSPDRPGYGRSDPQPGRTLLDWADDVRDIADSLGVDRFPVIGWSSGGQFAMACAVGLGDRITSVALIAADGPPDEVPGVRASYSPTVVALIDLVRTDPAAARLALLERHRWYADDPGSITRGAVEVDADDPDSVHRRDPAVRAALDAMFLEGARQGAAGLVDDLIAFHRPWGFSPADVRQPTTVWWGEEDPLTDRVHAEYLAAAVPEARLFIEPGEGHSLPLRHWARILAELEVA
jgi:pimeloyl-ACP methyl ester carboxylesterase